MLQVTVKTVLNIKNKNVKFGKNIYKGYACLL